MTKLVFANCLVAVVGTLLMYVIANPQGIEKLFVGAVMGTIASICYQLGYNSVK